MIAPVGEHGLFDMGFGVAADRQRRLGTAQRDQRASNTELNEVKKKKKKKKNGADDFRF